MKKILSVMLLAVMTASCFAGCGGNDADLGATQTQAPATQAPDNTGTETQAPDVVDDAPQYDYAKITWFFNESGVTVPPDAWPSKVAMERINVEYVHIPPGGTDYEARLMTLLSSGETPDIIGTFEPLTTQLRNEGLLLTLDEYLNEDYIPNIVNNSRRWEDALAEVRSPDGHWYVVPASTSRELPETTHWIRTDWLDKLGLEVPTTYDELKDVLIAFANSDGNGDGLNFFAMMANEYWGLGDIFMDLGAARGEWYRAEDGLVNLGQLSDQMKPALQYVRDLADAKAINLDIMTTNYDVITEKMKAGLVGYHYGWTGVDHEIEMQKLYPDASWEMIEPLKGAHDIGVLGTRQGGIVRNQYAISTACRDVDAALRLMNLMAEDTSDENGMTYEGAFWEMAFGQRGVNWEVIDGVFNLGDEESDLGKAIKAQNSVDTWVILARRFQSKFDTRWLGSTPEEIEINSRKRAMPTGADLPNTAPFKAIWVQSGMVDEALQQQVDNFVNKYDWMGEAYANLVYNSFLGTDTVDALFDKFYADAEADGYQEVRQIMADHIKANGWY